MDYDPRKFPPPDPPSIPLEQFIYLTIEAQKITNPSPALVEGIRNMQNVIGTIFKNFMINQMESPQ